MKKKFSMLLLGHIFFCATATEESPRDVEQVKYGNFSLPTSQQPGPLFSFGQNIVDKGDTLALLSVNPFTGPHMTSVTTFPCFLYGVTDRCAFFMGFPYLYAKQEGTVSHITAVSAELEYAFYVQNEPTYTNQATILGGFVAPVGSQEHNKSLQRSLQGSPNLPDADIKQHIVGTATFVLGMTCGHYTPEWLYFASIGGSFSTQHRGERPSSSFLYQAGFGRNIGTRPGWIFAWLFEADGIYSTPKDVGYKTERNTGSNIFYVTPSLWFSSERFILQAGVILIPAQHLFGCQTGNEIGGQISLSWKFNTPEF